MRLKRGKANLLISDIVTTNPGKGVANSGYVQDIDELLYLELYHGQGGKPRRTTNGRPLIDVVNPQPKAFYARLQGPGISANTQQPTQRVARRKRNIQ